MDKEIKIPVFDGEDYSMWKIRIRMFLKLKKCETVITRERTTADKEEDWIEQDLKAMNIIYSAISNKQLEFVCSEDSAYKVIKKLDNMYLKESTALQIVCRNKLEKLRLSNFSDTATFFNEFEKSVNELRSAGAKICEKEKLNYMLNTLPESYSYIGDLIDTLKEEDQTADYVKNKIKLAEMKNRSEDQETKTNVFAAKKNQRGRCHKCNKEGHFARDCPENEQAVKNNGTWRGSSRGRGRGRGGRGSNTRGRGYSNYQQQGARNDGEKNNTGASAWVARTCSAQGEKIHKNDMCAVEWLLDSGCTDHIANNERYFESLIVLKEPVKIYLGDNRVVKATKIGNITTYFNAFGCENRVDIKNVFYVKEMNANLISYRKLTEKNTIISKGDLTRVIDENNKVIAVGYKENRVIKLKGTLKENLNFVDKAERVNSISQKERWHRTLGHLNFGYLNILCKQQLLEGVPKDLESEFMKCQTCIENKMTSLPFENNRKRAKEILEIVHTDVCGSFKTSGLSGEKYFVSFIDDYSKIAKVYCIKSKDEVYDCFVRFINESENITGKKIKYLRCDNGTEYLNNRFYKLAKEKGIILNKCPPYVHELNGTAERFNRTIMDMARCLLAEAKVDKKYWPEIICAATYLKNRTLANTIEKKTPYEIFFKKRPNVEHLCIYGSKVFVRKPKQKRTSK